MHSDNLPSKYRLSLWRHVMETEFSLAFQTREVRPLNAGLDLLRLGSHAIGHLNTSPISHTINHEQARSSPASLQLFLVRRGKLQVQLKGRSFTILEGQAMAYRRDEERAFDYLSEETEASWVCLPVDALEHLVPDITDAIGQPIIHGLATMRQLDAYASLLMRLDEPISTDLARLAIRHITDLVAFCLRGVPPMLACDMGMKKRQTRRRAIEQMILTHLDDPELCRDDVAKHLDISPRYLQRLLHQDGVTFGDLVRDARLQRAHALLLNPGNGKRDVLSIALEAGFNDLSYFYRAFREKFGQPPARFRRAMRRPSADVSADV